MTSIDEQFVEFIVKSLVNNPDKVEINRSIDEKGVLLELTVDPEDLGRVIGKRGATAQSVRTLLRALGTKNDARYNLKIVDNGVGAPPKPAAKDDEDEKPAKKEEPTKSKKEDKEEEKEEKVAEKDEAEEVVEDAKDESTADDDEESFAERTRKELADLDDLEV